MLRAGDRWQAWRGGGLADGGSWEIVASDERAGESRASAATLSAHRQAGGRIGTRTSSRDKDRVLEASGLKGSSADRLGPRETETRQGSARAGDSRVVSYDSDVARRGKLRGVLKRHEGRERRGGGERVVQVGERGGRGVVRRRRGRSHPPGQQRERRLVVADAASSGVGVGGRGGGGRGEGGGRRAGRRGLKVDGRVGGGGLLVLDGGERSGLVESSQRLRCRGLSRGRCRCGRGDETKGPHQGIKVTQP